MHDDELFLRTLEDLSQKEESVNVDELSGRELDAAVAKQVFGHEIDRRTNTRTGAPDVVYSVGPGQWVRVPHYTVSMGASITVEVELQRRGWKRRAPALGGSHWNEPADVRVVFEHASGRTVEALGLVNEAICRAALKAVTMP